MFESAVREKVAGELFARELIERFVVIERADDVIAIGPDVARIVGVIADGVGEARDIEPGNGHAFAVFGHREQFFDEAIVVFGGGALFECFDFCGSGRETDQIKREAANESALIGLRGWFEGECFEAFLDEVIAMTAPVQPHGRARRCRRRP